MSDPYTDRSQCYKAPIQSWPDDLKKIWRGRKTHEVPTSFKKQELLPEKPLFGYVQPWNGFCPKCTKKDGCKNFRCSANNEKQSNTYAGIESECNPWIQMAGAVAKQSVETGGGPFGAVIVRVNTETEEIIEYWKGHNHVTEYSDPTAHAEVSTIRQVCKELSDRFSEFTGKDVPVFDLSDIKDPINPCVKSHCVIYSSAEPCPMCYAAINWARIPYLVFAATRYDAAAQGVDFSDSAIYDDLSRPYSDRKNTKVFQASCSNSLDAFNLWKRMEKTDY
jgi:guanine deaminase